LLDSNQDVFYNVTMSTKRRSDRKRILLSVAIAVLVSGCAAATGPDDTAGGETSRARGEDPKPPTTMIYPTTIKFPEPPGSTLSYGGETVEGGLGTYCWLMGGSGGCADAFAIILGEEALEAPAGATLSFAYRGKALDSLSVTAYRADREAQGGPREDDLFLPPYRSGGAKHLPVRRSGIRASIVADLPAGEYVLDVFARMPQGDASYGFRLILEPRDPGGP
jgi:hypothetical protein